MDQPWIKYGSTWINVDQPSSAFSLQPSASWLTCQRHASGVRRHASGVRLMIHGSCVVRQTHDSWLMRRASDSWLMRRASDSWLMAHASGVHASGVPRFRRQTPRAPFSPFSPFSRRPLSVMTTTKRRHFPHATAPRFAPIELYGMG